MTLFGACFWAHGATWPEMRDAARAAEAAGFDSIWTDDHLVNDMGDRAIPVFEGWTTLAAWAAVTSRPRLGLLVGAAPLRDPGLLAKTAITVDHISGGRVTLGLGSGWFAPEYEHFGIAFGNGEERADRLDELATVVRGLLDGETVTDHGRQYHLDGAFATPRLSRPTCRSSSADPARGGRSGPSRGSPTCGTCPTARRNSSSPATPSSASTRRNSVGTRPRSSGRSSSTVPSGMTSLPHGPPCTSGRHGSRARSSIRR